MISHSAQGGWTYNELVCQQVEGILINYPISGCQNVINPGRDMMAERNQKNQSTIIFQSKYFFILRLLI